MAVTLPEGIRVAGGLFALAFGVWLLAQRASSPRARPTAWAIVLFGASGALGNLTGAFEDGSLFTFAAGLAHAAGLAPLGALFWIEARAGPARAGACAAFGAVSGVLACVVLFAFAKESLLRTFGTLDTVPNTTLFVASIVVAGVISGYALLAGLRAREAAQDAQELGVLAATFAPVSIVALAQGNLPYDTAALRLIAGLPLIAAIVVWAQARPAASRSADLFLVLTIAAGLAAVLARPFGRDIGLGGVVRLATIGVLAYAIHRWRVLGLPVRPRQDRSAALVTAFLVLLLIVAQVAQNFLSAQYSLVMGGVVSGALVFAARPIERALEGPRRSRPTETDADKLAVYRDAARRSVRDGRVAREEEMHLARLARHLGIPHEMAVQVRHEVEDEPAATPRDGHRTPKVRGE